MRPDPEFRSVAGGQRLPHALETITLYRDARGELIDGNLQLIPLEREAPGGSKCTLSFCRRELRMHQLTVQVGNLFRNALKTLLPGKPVVMVDTAGEKGLLMTSFD